MSWISTNASFENSCASPAVRNTRSYDDRRAGGSGADLFRQRLEPRDAEGELQDSERPCRPAF